MGLTFDEVVRELKALVGHSVLLQFRPIGHDRSAAEFLDSIDRVWGSHADTQYIVLSEAEASVILRRGEFAEGAWESTGWRPGDDGERVLRVRVGSLEIGFQVTEA